MKKLVILGGLAALLLGSFFIMPAAIAAGPWSRGGVASDNSEAYGWGNCPMWGGNGPGAQGTYVGSELQRIATFLGITQDELKTQLQQGKSLAQIAEAKNITKQALIDFVMAPVKDFLQLGVKYGYLIQTQADEALKARQEWANAFVDRTHTTPQAGAPSQAGGPKYGPRSGGNGLGLGRMGPGMMGGVGGPGRGGMMGGYGRTW